VQEGATNHLLVDGPQQMKKPLQSVSVWQHSFTPHRDSFNLNTPPQHPPAHLDPIINCAGLEKGFLIGPICPPLPGDPGPDATAVSVVAVPTSLLLIFLGLKTDIFTPVVKAR
jgi:hypothetical protein